ncbi:L,D-transpeptidase [Jiella sp. MQZ9-1]|uniref:L,D-transpeptidase n=1 Tax=Jiella flava TaxID=2816857 RepID=A0A939JXS8_9HYPH|nr:L,D-transpeptidase [Jiella flava]MBO0663681.1 L,D-transpeptidase [Jiella flava]MCD2472254.1 L,D-transpeptidase [Jiella flava]
MLRRVAFTALALTAGLAALGSGASAEDRGAWRPEVRIAAETRTPWLIEFGDPSGVVLGARTPDSGTAIRSATLETRIAAPARVRAIDPHHAIDPKFLPQTVAYRGREKPGTIIINSDAHFLYLVGPNGTARRYGVGTGKPGFGWRGIHQISRKAEWPGWTPPAQMIARERAKGRILPVHMPGGIQNPLGARAMYLGSTLFRIHGTNQPWTIGQAVSSGCIRMRNQDVVDLYDRVKLGTRVVVR